MKVKKKGHPGLVFDGTTGQVIPSDIPAPPADDIPTIVERYIALVGKVVAELEQKNGFENKDINAVASIGRSVAMLQSVEESRLARIGNRSVKEITTSQLRKLIGDNEQDGPEEENEELS